MGLLATVRGYRRGSPVVTEPPCHIRDTQGLSSIQSCARYCEFPTNITNLGTANLI